jgi:predicted transcriptional regulator
MRKNRNEIQIIFEFLSCINDGNSQISSILRKVNIPYTKYEELLKYLDEKEMIKVTVNGDKNEIQLLDKGRLFLSQYGAFSKMMEKSYGLKL